MYKTTDYPRELQEARRQAVIAAITRRSAKPSVSAKLREIVGAPPQVLEARKPLFTALTGDVPIGVIESVLERRTAYWGRYE